MLTFIFLQALALWNARVAKKALETAQQERATELERENARLRVEHDESRIKIAGV
jgi:hypothetical protein